MSLQTWLPCLLALVLADVGTAQQRGLPFGRADEMRLDRERMLREKKQQSVREGELIHLLIRHGIGLSVDAEAVFALSKSEQQMSPGVARMKLRELQTELATRAAELREESIGLPEITTRPEAAPLAEVRVAGSGTGARGTGASATGAGGSAASVAAPVRRRPEPQPIVHRPTSRPLREVLGKVQAVITGSSNRSAVGRILFKAGNYTKALKELAPVEQDKSANLGDLFYLARCQEELHRVAKRQAEAVSGEAVRATAEAAAAGQAADAIRDSGSSNRAVGGTMRSRAEYDELRRKQAAASAAHQAKTAEVERHNRQAAEYYEKAYNVFILIEGRDVRVVKNGQDVPGKWAEAARSARNMMQWISTSRDWTPPALQWNQQ